MAPLLLFVILSLASLATAEDRSHGLDKESPAALSPQAYAFFHPDTRQTDSKAPCNSSGCAAFPLAATVESTPAQESTSSGGNHKGAGGIAGIPFAFVFACLMGVGIYHVVIKRRANLQRANPQQQQLEV